MRATWLTIWAFCCQKKIEKATFAAVHGQRSANSRINFA